MRLPHYAPNRRRPFATTPRPPRFATFAPSTVPTPRTWPSWAMGSILRALTSGSKSRADALEVSIQVERLGLPVADRAVVELGRELDIPELGPVVEHDHRQVR